MNPKYLIWFLFGSIVLISLVSCQDEDDEEDEEYDVDVPERTTQAKSITATSNSQTAVKSDTTTTNSVTRASVASEEPISTPQPTTSTRRIRTTTLDPDDDDYEEPITTPRRRVGYPAYVAPLTNLLDSVGKGNITGIVDHALSFRAPAPIRDMVNMIMGSVFNVGMNLSSSAMNTMGLTVANIIPSLLPLVNLPVPGAPTTSSSGNYPSAGAVTASANAAAVGKQIKLRIENLACKSKL